MTKNKIGKVISISGAIGFTALVLDWLWHYFILLLIYKEPLSPLGYWISKFLIGFFVSLIVLMLFKIKNIWVNSINIGLGGAVIFAITLTLFRNFGVISSRYNFLLHIPHFFAYFLSAIIVLKLFKWR